MTQTEIEHMWKVASNNPNHDTNWHDPVVVTFAKLIAQHEREACAKVCEAMKWYMDDGEECAYAIRARGTT
jgi:thioesterase domain-containing protein